MNRMSIIIGIMFISALAAWMFPPVSSFAQGGKLFVKSQTHVAGVVIGKPVRSETNVVLGTVQNIVLNDSGCVEYLVVIGQFSGARARLYPIPWTVIARSAPEAIFLRVDERILVNAPSFEANRWPDLRQSEWKTKIHAFFQDPAKAAKFGKPREWEKEAGEGKGPAEGRGKALEQRRLEDQKTLELRKGKQIEPKKDQGVQPAPRMMERGKPQQQMERGQPKQMKERGGPQMERGRPDIKGKDIKSLEKKEPSQGELR